MIKITVISLGKLKEKYYLAAAEEYIKRLKRYCDLKIVEIMPVPLSENPSEAEIKTALNKEAEMIKKQIQKNCFSVALCIEGKALKSEDFSKLIKENENIGKPICFIVGSSFGLADSVKKAADLCLSVSEMTFPHKLFRVMLLEQIYRAFKIGEGSAYHK